MNLEDKIKERMMYMPFDSRLTSYGITFTYEIVRAGGIRTEVKINATNGAIKRQITIPFNALPLSEVTFFHAVIIDRFWAALPDLIIEVSKQDVQVALNNFIFNATPDDAIPARENFDEHLAFREISCNGVTVKS